MGLHLGPDSAPRARMDWAAERAREQARVDAACPPARPADAGAELAEAVRKYADSHKNDGGRPCFFGRPSIQRAWSNVEDALARFDAARAGKGEG